MCPEEEGYGNWVRGKPLRPELSGSTVGSLLKRQNRAGKGDISVRGSDEHTAPAAAAGRAAAGEQVVVRGWGRGIKQGWGADGKGRWGAWGGE